ncbi:MAG: AraC family transcriptional regulator [Clostridiaceae bacterium]|nr:AraC family transcriptional regulator [Clostridiaceae bacterium]
MIARVKRDYVKTMTQYSLDLSIQQAGIQSGVHRQNVCLGQEDDYRLFYVMDGSLTLSVDGKVFKVQKRQGICLYPAADCSCLADSDSGWSVCWIDFSGASAAHYMQLAGLSPPSLLFSSDHEGLLEQTFKQITEVNGQYQERNLGLLGLLLRIMSCLIEHNAKSEIPLAPLKQADDYIRTTIDYISKNYTRKNLSITEISGHIGLNSSYLCAVFQKNVHLSIKEYLIRYRINRSLDLLKNTDLPIGSIANAVGYEDPLLFSKMFRKVKGLPPSDFRRLNQKSI